MSFFGRLPAEPFRLITLHPACSSSRRSLSSSFALQLDKKAYSHTLRLPKTTVPLRHKDPVSVEAGLRVKLSDKLYRWQRKQSGPPFVLLDGPPYANGNLHMGHALNKVLKDFINRYKVLRGHRVHFHPGWDCHGLPIEQKALAAAKISHTSAEPTEIRDIARKTALEAVEIQKKEMRDLGVMANWDNQAATYRTLDRGYEIRQLRMFKNMVDMGHITHRLKPTYYSPKSRTALAESELRYMDDHESRSVYIRFDVAADDMSGGLKRVWEGLGGREGGLGLGIWTTTPWTLVSNLGVAVRNDLTYTIVRTSSGQLLVLQQDRVEPMQEILGGLEVVAELSGSDLVGTRYSHFFHPSTSSRPRPAIMHASHVTTESGTGLVHMAPVHGHEDYAAFMAAGYSPDDLNCAVDDDGRLIPTLSDHLDVPQKLLDRIIGKEVLGDAPAAVIDLLRDDGTLLAEQKIKHRYPYDWKSKTPVIIRATSQWFANVEAVKERAAAALEKIEFYPAASRQRLSAFVSSRSEWCISRQRSWGVPIPVLFDEKDKPILYSGWLEHALKVLREKGIEHWWTGPLEDFIPPTGTNVKVLRKGHDTLDVWFDSGAAWTSIPGVEPADVILEGSDQHRGWFQSTLLTRLMCQFSGTTPAAKRILTHGFVTDEKGLKMSKSDGNGTSPMEIIHGGKDKPAYGADVLRMWAASVDYSKDVSLGPSSMANASEQLRKLRSVLRFALGNVADAPASAPSLAHLDLWVLHELHELELSVLQAFEKFEFSRALQSISSFASATLSALYYDVNKDILYCDGKDSERRQAVIYTLDQVLKSLLPMIAPIVPHMAEELNQALPEPFSPTVFAAGWPFSGGLWGHGKQDLPMYFSDKFNSLLDVRSQLQTLFQTCREEKLLKSSAEVDVWLDFYAYPHHHLRKMTPPLASMLGCASTRLGPAPEAAARKWTRTIQITLEGEPVDVIIAPTEKHQCPRCWLYQAEELESLCKRCGDVLA